MDKVNLSIAIIPMSHQFGWSSSVAGLVQSSFFWGYALSQLPGGWLSKIFGGSSCSTTHWIYARVTLFSNFGENRRRCFPLGCNGPYCQACTVLEQI